VYLSFKIFKLTSKYIKLQCGGIPRSFCLLESFGWESKIIKLLEYYFCVEAVTFVLKQLSTALKKKEK